ncbi:MAG: HD domain-containing protein [Rhodocyclaceae bacterium]|nr:HD domain-containing protein [Rhodocyclaceae bacterium]
MKNTTERQHCDLMNDLNRKLTVAEKVEFLHRIVREQHDAIHRIGVAIYDAECDLLKTFTHSSDNGNPLPHYQCKLREAKSLYQIHRDGRPRVVNDLAVFGRSRHRHAQAINAAGYRASYTVPMYQDEQLIGFVFFNSRLPGTFAEERLPYLDTIARLISLLVNVELSQARTLHGALRTATCFSGHKDPETGAHLERMARFSRLIANGVASDYGLSDELVEAIFWFAPMHDIGKIAIPDYIIRKPGKLTPAEFEIMKAHTTRGREIVNAMLENFHLDRPVLISMIGNIAQFHHENVDGSGYPLGLFGENIPIEARIVAVADVFDALTSKRTYKEAWSNEDAFDALRAMATWKLDPRCVETLIARVDEIVEIQTLFAEKSESEGSHINPKLDSSLLAFAPMLGTVL